MAKSKLSSDVLVSVATVPMLIALVGSKVLAEVAQSLGLASEEVFRGDRLPVLHVPITSSEPEHQDANLE
jgi:hypothetical protein